jgi:hypothetical protein
MSRPESKNVFYFPHYTKSTIELDLIEHKYNSEGYKAYYRLQEMVADADYHCLSLATEDEKDMFELGMNCKQEVVDDVIRILLDRDRIDRELWENESVIWMQDFVNTLKPLYQNRRKPLPDKNIVPTSNNSISTSNNSISTSGNTEKRKEKKIKEKESREKGDSLLSFDQYEKQFPDKNVKTSLRKYFDYSKQPTHDGATRWLKNEKIKKKPEFKRFMSGLYEAFCEKCGKREMPDETQLKFPSTECCGVGYVNEKPSIGLNHTHDGGN